MIFKARYLFWQLFAHQMICRGGIAFGDIFHSDLAVFGSALNEAYMTESQISKYPRIALADSAKREYINFIENTPKKNRGTLHWSLH